MKSLAIFVTCLAVVCIACNNYCNGHGECEKNDRCACYLGWGGADCSLSISFDTIKLYRSMSIW